MSLHTQISSKGTSSSFFSPSTVSFPSETLFPPRPPTGFHDLPRDVLVNIFSYFSEKELGSNLSPVCRNWRSAAQHQSLWKHLKFSGHKMPVTAICRKLRCAPQLETAKFTAVPDIITVIRQLCRCNVHIKTLVLRYCTDNSKEERLPDAVLKNIITSCRELRSLDFKGTQFFAHRFVQDLLRLPHLKSLNLSQNRYLRVRDLVAVSLNCRGLEELKVSRLRPREGQPSITDADASFIFENLRNTLLSVKFDTRGLGPATFQAILNCSKLQRLCLNNALLLNGEFFRSIASHLLNIRVLKVGNAGQLTSEDFIYLFERHREVMKYLTSLDASGCWKLGDQGLKAVVETCGKHLEYLNLRCCKSLTGDGLEYVFQKCPKLRHLDIAHVVQLSEHSLHNIETHVPRLQILVIDDDTKKEGALIALKAKMPELKISLSISEFSKKKTEFTQEEIIKDTLF